MKKFTEETSLCGIIVYEIKENGCLNGLYTNNDPNRQVMNQIAKKFKEDKSNDILGMYTTAWIEGDNEIRNGTLEIKPERNEIYSLEEIVESKILYKGSGFKFGNLLVATYWKI